MFCDVACILGTVSFTHVTPLHEMQSLSKHHLYLRCSPKDKWILLYFMLALDCSVCVLDSLYYTAFAFLAVKNLTDLDTIEWIFFIIRRDLGERLDRKRIVADNTKNIILWKTPFTKLDLRTYWHDGGYMLSLRSVKKMPWLQIQTGIRVDNGILYFADNDIVVANFRKFNAGFFVWFLMNRIEETVKVYLN